MTAKQDLIAAALSAADELDIIGGHFSITADGLREMCARAMAQPDIAEVEKLLAIYGGAQILGDKSDRQKTRAALLDYVRDHFGDADKMVQPVSEVPTPEPAYLNAGFEGWGSPLRSAYSEDDMRTYGEQCRAAGYAAGVAAGGEDARPTCEKCGGSGWVRGRELDDADDATFDDTMTRYSCDRCDKCAALRGEVKP